ncbi:MAG: plastocyanin [Halioglobus sp.]|nr:plastocyanin [Halioglobus sp.]
MLLINIAGVALIALIVWWFWLYKAREVALDDDDLVIVVENGTYTPARIRLAANQAAELHFLRKDASPCSEMLLLPELEISESLPMNKSKSIKLPPMAEGEYDFHCQMQMYRGVLKVE